MSKPIKMKELEVATGVGRESIRFYIREGLLPEPERPSRNVAYYDESFVARILLIKELQTKRFLPLSVIRQVLDGKGTPEEEVAALLSDLDTRLPPSSFGATAKQAPRPVADFAKESGVAEAEIREFADFGAFSIFEFEGRDCLDHAGVRVLELWEELRRGGFSVDMGYTPQTMRVYVDLARWLAADEINSFASTALGRVDQEHAAEMAGAGIQIVARFFEVLRESMIRRLMVRGDLPEVKTPPEVEVRRLNEPD